MFFIFNNIFAKQKLIEKFYIIENIFFIKNSN